MSDALSTTAEALARRALLVLPADQPRGRADVARLPAPIGRLLAARLDRAVDTAAPSSPWIDHTDDKVREATDAWREAARNAVQFPTDDWKGAVEAAASQALEHLVRPAATVADAAVPEGNVSIETAIARGRRFGAYPYLLEVAARYAERKEIGQVDRNTFHQLLDRIDRRMVEPFGADEWINLLNPLFALVAPVGVPAGTVPAGVLEAAFRARGADEIASRFSGNLTVEEVTEHIEAALRGDEAPVIEDAPTPSAEPTRPVATEPPELTPAPLPPIADESVPSIVGSMYGTPELDDLDESSVLGPARPVSKPVADLEDPFRPAESVAEPEEAAAPTTPAPETKATPDAKPKSPLEQILGLRPEGDSDGSKPPPKDEPLWKRLARQRESSENVAPQTTAAPPASPAPDDVPMWKRFAQSDLANRLPPQEAEEYESETIDPADVTVDSDEVLDAREPVVLEDDATVSDLEDGAESNSPSDDSPADDLEVRVLGPDAGDRRSWYVTELFEGSAADYRATLQAIDDVDSYTEATTVVSANVLVKHSVSPFSDAAIAFIDAVQFQFDQR